MRTESFESGNLDGAPLSFTFERGVPGLTHHSVEVSHDGFPVGRMEWHLRTGRVLSVEVDPAYRRRGIATQMWQYAHRLSASNRGVKAPAHSADRTDAGQAWAESVGGRLPRRRKAEWPWEDER